MSKKSRFTVVDKLVYYYYFLIHKALIARDTKKGLKQIYAVEIIWLLETLFHKKIDPGNIVRGDFFETVFGKFYVPQSMMGTYIASPAFERRDIDYLLQLVKKDLDSGKKVLFIDVGAYFGTYCVALGTLLKKYKNLYMVAFEPEANMFFENNFELLQKNIKINKVKNITLYKEGLGSENTSKKNKFGVITKKLDTFLGIDYPKKFNSVFMKLDIEGSEVDALRGCEKFIRNCQEFTLIVEDYIARGLYNYLDKRFEFLKKLTPQNSFWVKS